MYTLSETLERMQKIDGWFTTLEGEGLYRAASVYTPTDIAIEIGSYHGRSTTVLGCCGLKVIAVDPLSKAITGNAGLSGQTWDGKSLDLVNGLGDKDADLLRAAIAPFPNITWLRQMTTELRQEQLPGKASLLFIDGNHTYPAPKRDFEYCVKFLKPEATICFHDYSNKANPGVVKSVDELVTAGQIRHAANFGSLWVGKLL